MNLNAMQDLLNNLEKFFKIFIYPKQEQITLRVFYNVPTKSSGYEDVIYDMNGNYVRTV